MGQFQEWKLKYPEITFKPLQHITGPLNPANLPTRTTCTALDVEMNTPGQNGPSFLRLPREEWPVSRDFKNEILEDKVVKTSKTPTNKLCHLKVSTVSFCSYKTCSLLADPCGCSACKVALKPNDSLCFQSLRHIMTRTNRIEKSRGIMARVICTSNAIKKGKMSLWVLHSPLKIMNMLIGLCHSLCSHK